jgi:hypothetical protein
MPGAYIQTSGRASAAIIAGPIARRGDVRKYARAQASSGYSAPCIHRDLRPQSPLGTSVVQYYGAKATVNESDPRLDSPSCVDGSARTASSLGELGAHSVRPRSSPPSYARTRSTVTLSAFECATTYYLERRGKVAKVLWNARIPAGVLLPLISGTLCQAAFLTGGMRLSC